MSKNSQKAKKHDKGSKVILQDMAKAKKIDHKIKSNLLEHNNLIKVPAVSPENMGKDIKKHMDGKDKNQLFVAPQKTLIHKEPNKLFNNPVAKYSDLEKIAQLSYPLVDKITEENFIEKPVFQAASVRLLPIEQVIDEVTQKAESARPLYDSVYIPKNSIDALNYFMKMQLHLMEMTCNFWSAMIKKNSQSY